MKMVKSLLLGSAVGFVAVAGAQAADLPVKAKPVEYVKVCSLYGAGFWYVPGTDTCIKIGTYLRWQMEWNANAGGIPIGSGGTGAAGPMTRANTNESAFRARGVVSLDARTQTEYGTLRSYIRAGWQQTSPTDAGAAVFGDRFFLQFMGFTAGLAQSYFDILSFAPFSYGNARNLGDTGASGIGLFAYTAQLGNGVSLTASIEDGGAGAAGTGAGGGRGHLTTNMTFNNSSTCATAAFGSFCQTNFFPGNTLVPNWAFGSTTYDNAGFRMPDLVGALRIDQAWGSAQVAAALHDASGGYYTSGSGSLTGAETRGHPQDKFGWAVTGGFILKDFLGNKGDTLGAQAVYGVGAAGYVTRATGAWNMYGSGRQVAVAWPTDGIFCGFGNPAASGSSNNACSNLGNTSVILTEAWGFGVAWEHLWSSKWRTSVYGGYTEFNHRTAAKNIICSNDPSHPNGVTIGAAPMPTATGGASTQSGGFTGGVSNCNPDFSWWQVGTRTQWNPHPDIDIGIDVLYTRLNTAFRGTANIAAVGSRVGGSYNVSDQDIWTVMMRWQRNFIP